MILDPEHGHVGSWVRLPDGTVGQVWAESPNRKVYVVDAQQMCHEVAVEDLHPPVDDRQDTLI